MHAVPPAETGQIVCYERRTYRVLPTHCRHFPLTWNSTYCKLSESFALCHRQHAHSAKPRERRRVAPGCAAGASTPLREVSASPAERVPSKYQVISCAYGDGNILMGPRTLLQQALGAAPKTPESAPRTPGISPDDSPQAPRGIPRISPRSPGSRRTRGGRAPRTGFATGAHRLGPRSPLLLLLLKVVVQVLAGRRCRRGGGRRRWPGRRGAGTLARPHWSPALRTETPTDSWLSASPLKTPRDGGTSE